MTNYAKKLTTKCIKLGFHLNLPQRPAQTYLGCRVFPPALLRTAVWRSSPPPSSNTHQSIRACPTAPLSTLVHGCLVSLGHCAPVHQLIHEGLDEVRAAIAVVDVVGMLRGGGYVWEMREGQRLR